MANKENKKFQLQMRSTRTFSTEFKKEKVKDLIEKRTSIKMLVELYGVSRSAIYKWLYLYSPMEKGIQTVVQMESEEQKTKVLLNRLAECERIIGQKQMQLDVLEKTFEIASEELGYDVKKKYAPGPWNGSCKTLSDTCTP
ncbi:MAG TPA: transposase [Saprospiraceae bacterium]|nr:transposase [Saprospiraceae bacterium]